ERLVRFLNGNFALDCWIDARADLVTVITGNVSRLINRLAGRQHGTDHDVALFLSQPIPEDKFAAACCVSADPEPRHRAKPVIPQVSLVLAGWDFEGVDCPDC